MDDLHGFSTLKCSKCYDMSIRQNDEVPAETKPDNLFFQWLRDFHSSLDEKRNDIERMDKKLS